MEKCPICGSEKLIGTSNGRLRCDSSRCKGICFNPMLVRAPNMARDEGWQNLHSAALELQRIHGGVACIEFDGKHCFAFVYDLDGSQREHVIRTFPSTVREKASKVLAELARRTEYFGQTLQLTEDDYPIAYVASSKQLIPYIDLLEEQGYLKVGARATNGYVVVKLTASGIEANGKVGDAPKVTVFISSTCRDLVDCRHELARHLEANGFIPRLSELPETFEQSRDGGALASCLHSIEHSDAVVVIFDGLYGSVVESGEHAGKSITHVEVEHALKIGKPVCIFVRDRAFADFVKLKEDATATAAYVERADPEKQRRWVNMVEQLTNHPADGLRKRFVDQFTSVVDLKELVTKRLASRRSEIP